MWVYHLGSRLKMSLNVLILSQQQMAPNICKTNVPLLIEASHRPSQSQCLKDRETMSPKWLRHLDQPLRNSEDARFKMMVIKAAES